MKDKVFCVNCHHMQDFAVRVPRLTRPQDFRCLKFPTIRTTAIEQCEVFERCNYINQNNDCEGFKQVGTVRNFFRRKPR